MFRALAERLSKTLTALRGRGRLSESDVRDAVRELRMALLEADVALPVVKSFTDGVRERALGAEVAGSLTPGQTFVKIVRDALVEVMGEGACSLELRVRPPAVILLAGLQGAGKTTTAAKLARWLMERERRSVMLASADVYRPAAVVQLERLASEVGARFFRAPEEPDPVAIAVAAKEAARRAVVDVLVLDTAGRLHVDTGLMDEIRRLHAAVEPAETLFVIDAMAGQDAVNAARAFADAVPLTGIVLTKADGDARGGAALSVRAVTGRPIKFIGVGEKTDALEPFDPTRIAGRILGMGDVLALIERAERQAARTPVAAVAPKRPGDFDLEDLRAQLRQVLALGGVGSLLDMLPGADRLPAGAVDDRVLRRQIAIVDSMTPLERRKPQVLNGSRRRRIAAGAGVTVQDVNRLLKQYETMRQVMKRLAGGGLGKRLRGLKGRLPPGFPGF
ncbi:MAG TPA: signal recognition particle protein [Gammaproteobacteria bacterium]|nr:signal recognition particle protein [Gammaproteobacteria bacterium]